MIGASEDTTLARRPESVDARLRRVVAMHFDPEWGTPFWLDRAESLAVDPIRTVQTVEDLALLGEMSPSDLAARPLRDFVPAALYPMMDQFILGQTGGTTGDGQWTAYRADEFHEAFVNPFAVAATHVGFPRGAQWLYIGPTGPHIIGKAAPQLARCVGSADPFSVDFDARWIKKLPDGSFARDRYTQHVVQQAMAVIENQNIEVLFTTPPVLTRLAELMTVNQRDRIRGVHYGGMALSPHELERFQLETFPNAVHLSGYGNTLFGCCVELTGAPGRPLDYYPFGDRLLLETVDRRGAPVPDGEIGTLRFTRLDESMLLVRMRERDAAACIAVPNDAPRGFVQVGVRNPGPPPSPDINHSVGLY